MLRNSAAKYYLNSILTLGSNFNWWFFPLLLIKKPILIKIKNNNSYYVSNLMDIWTLKEVIVDKQYEECRKIENNDFVIDIGAAIGDFSIYAAQKANRVVAYEISDERVFLMKRNLIQNGISNVVIKHSKATSLKQIMEDVDRCNFFKIDCEGGEYEIFRDARKTDLDKINHIAMEAHTFNKKMEEEFLNLLNILKQNNFNVSVIPNQVHSNICFVFASKK